MTTAHATAPAPAVSSSPLTDPADIRRDVLLTLAHDYDQRQDPTDYLRCELRDTDLGSDLERDVVLGLLALALHHEAGDRIGLHLTAIADGQQRLTAYETADGHDHCCGGACTVCHHGRTRLGADRCVGCDDDAHQGVEAAVDALLWDLSTTVSVTARRLVAGR